MYWQHIEKYEISSEITVHGLKNQGYYSLYLTHIYEKKVLYAIGMLGAINTLSKYVSRKIEESRKKDYRFKVNRNNYVT